MSRPSKNIEDLITLVRLQLGVRNVEESSELQADLGAESIDMQNLVSVVEERHGVVLEDDELERIVTVGDLYKLLHEKA